MIYYSKISNGLTNIFKNYVVNVVTIKNNNLKVLLGNTTDGIKGDVFIYNAM